MQGPPASKGQKRKLADAGLPGGDAADGESSPFNEVRRRSVPLSRLPDRPPGVKRASTLPIKVFGFSFSQASKLVENLREGQAKAAAGGPFSEHVKGLRRAAHSIAELAKKGASARVEHRDDDDAQ